MRTLAKIVSAVLLLGATTLYADNAGSAAPAPASVGPQEPLVSIADMRTRSIAVLQQIGNDGRLALSLREVARRQKDVIKLNCVNDKIVEVKAQQNIADDTNRALLVALDANSDDRHAEFTKLNQTAAAVHLLREEAKECIGGPELYKQESGNQVDRPETPDDPTVDPTLPGNGWVIEPPRYSSPYS